MTALITTFTEGERDEVYYWDTVQFLVGGCIFKVPRYQFVAGSAYFTKKLGPSRLGDSEADDAPITLDLEGVTAPQFRVFLKLLFPIHTTSVTLSFTKAEWLIILELSTLWHFHEFRKLAKEHLEPQLDNPIEQIVLGRAAYVPKWLSDGYKTLVARPECISEKESERIGHLTTVRLYILRHERALDSVTSRFYEEIHELERKEKAHRTSDERLRAAEEARIAQELAVEEAERNRRRLAAETEAERQRLVAEEAAHMKEQEDEATGSREEVRVEQELVDTRNQSEVDLASACSIDHPGEAEIPPQVESYLAALTIAPAKPTTATSRTTTAAKPAPGKTATTKSTTTARTAGKQSVPPSGSISSIKESKEDNKAFEDLQGQLKEVEESLKAKTESVSALEVELEKLQGSFQTALEDVQSKTTLVTELETTKTTLESPLSEAQASLSGLQGDLDQEVSLLQSVKDELEAAKGAAQASASQVAALQSQIAELQAIVAANEQSLKALQAQHAAVLEDVEASDVEHETLLKAKADFEAISKEAEALKATHGESLRAARATIAELEGKAAELETLQSQVEEFKAEKEENANKITELEVEVLEVKEQIEELEDTRDKLKATIAGLEADVAKSAQALEELQKASDEKESDANARAEALKAEHAQEVNEASERAAALQDTLRSLQEQLSVALGAQEEAAKDAAAAQASHDEQVQQLEAARAEKEAELNARIAAIQESLDNQAAIYNSKVQGVKDEHEVLLKDAFERAKEKALKALKEELDKSREKAEELAREVERKNMEIKYLEQDQEEHQGEITRLSELVSRLGGEPDAA